MTACNKSEILAPTDQRPHLHVVSGERELVFNFSFISTTKETVQIAVPIKFAGRPLTEDLSWPERSTRRQADDAESQRRVRTPGAGFPQGELPRHDLRHGPQDRPDGERHLQPQIQPRKQQNFFATQTGFLEAELRVTAQIAQPSWWNQSVVDFYLGTYSDKKFGLFSQNIFTGDYGELSDSEKTGSMRSNSSTGSQRNPPDGGGRHTDESGDPGLTIKRDRL